MTLTDKIARVLDGGVFGKAAFDAAVDKLKRDRSDRFAGQIVALIEKREYCVDQTARYTKMVDVLDRQLAAIETGAFIISVEHGVDTIVYNDTDLNVTTVTL